MLITIKKKKVKLFFIIAIYEPTDVGLLKESASSGFIYIYILLKMNRTEGVNWPHGGGEVEGM